jgi:peptidoglycan hydrolase CwlO-like protein
VPNIEREVDDLNDKVGRLQYEIDQLRADFRKAIQRIDWLESWRTRYYEARE